MTQNSRPRAGQFRKPGLSFDEAAAPAEEHERGAAPLPPETGRYGIPQFQFPPTGRLPISQFRLLATDQQKAAQFASPLTENIPQIRAPAGAQEFQAPTAPAQPIPSYPLQAWPWQPSVSGNRAVTSAPLPAINGSGASLFQPTLQQSAPPVSSPLSWQNAGTTASPWIERAGAGAAPVPASPTAPRATRMEKTPFIAVAFNIMVIAAIVFLSQHTLFPSPHSQVSSRRQAQPALNTITNNQQISPLIFGTNMGLFHSWDEPILTSAKTRQLLKEIGVRVIRMPTRPTLSDATETAAAQAIKEIGAVPLIIINGPEFKGGSILQTDQHLLALFAHVFGKETVYYEFGNEADLHGVNAEQYAQVWNEVIPQLQQAYPAARFLGPDMSQFDRNYLMTFLQQAHPRPVGVSWHEYTCSVHWTADFCLSLIDTWAGHFIQARAAMQQVLGATLPIWITEWNYASDQQIINGQPINDGKYNDPAFMQQWMTKAMQALIAGRVYASMQYFATDTPMPLISGNQISTEGQVFQQEYKKVMVDGYTPPAVTSIPPAAPLPAGAHPLFSFEDGGTDGWTSFGAGITQPVNTTRQAFSGTHSLALTLDNASADAAPYITISAADLPSVPRAGQMLTAYIYVASKEALVSARIFVAEPSHTWNFASSMTLVPDQWNKVWYALPQNFSARVSQIGIQFFTLQPGASSEVYIDAISWG